MCNIKYRKTGLNNNLGVFSPEWAKPNAAIWSVYVHCYVC